MTFLGVDTGGTFTDFVLFDEGRLTIHKVLSTPEAPEKAILQGIHELGIELKGLRIVHGSTVATNAVLEGKGVKTVFITNRGFGDMLTIGRQARSELYNLQPEPLDPPVEKALCLETGGRVSATGELLEKLTDEDLATLKKQIDVLEPRAVAVNLLFSWLDADAEQHIRAGLPDALFVSLSSEVLPEIREYERGIATWLNAWVGPLVEGYVHRLETGCPGARVSVIQSSGDTVEASQAAGQAVRMLLSGPAGGLVGAGYLGNTANETRLLTFDMGGTSTDVALLDGEPCLTNEGRIGRWPVAVSMVDMHTIGAGGGSIASLDAGGMLHVGPESAGADPGPACYGQGGMQVTVTDANLVLGRLQPGAFLGGRMQLDVDAAKVAVASLADAMGVSMIEAAEGILAVANEHMAQALRMISIQRGANPADYTLMSFGGAGGMHVCALADRLEMQHAIVPMHAGVLSAFGMLVTRPGREVSQTWQCLLGGLRDSDVIERFDELAAHSREMLLREGVESTQLTFDYSVDLRYKGQSYTLNLPWTTVVDTAQAFHALHEQRYGHSLTMPIELLNLRVRVRGEAITLHLDTMHERAEGLPVDHVTVAGTPRKVPVFERASLASGQQITGPAIIVETVSTTFIADKWHCRVSEQGHLMLDRIT